MPETISLSLNLKKLQLIEQCLQQARVQIGSAREAAELYEQVQEAIHSLANETLAAALKKP